MQHINNTPANSGLGDTLKVAFDKVNANFQELVAIDASFSGDIQTLNTIISDGSTLNHTHTISQIIGLQTALSGKVSTSTFNTQILAINSSIQAINSTLSDIIDILNTKIGDAPFSGITYGRRDGAWVEISGGTPSGDYVPYTGATKPVDLNTQSITAGGGLFVSPFSGNTNNKAEFATPYGGNSNFRQIQFYNYGDDVEYSSDKSIEIGANIEEGFAVNVRETNGQLGSLGVNYSGINLQVNNDTDSNLVQVFPTYTDFSRRLYTPEGFEGNYVQFNTGATESSLPGKMYWNDTQGTLNIGLKGGQTTIKSGVDLVVRIVNKVTPNTTLTKAAYQAVRVSGAQGQRLAVELAQANNDNNSADTIGIVCETIAPNQEGFIMTVGQLEGINTTGSLQGESWSDGDVLYLSPTTAGRLTNIKPVAPGHIVVMGYVEYAHSQNGKIYVKIMNGWELDELHNVSVANATDGQVLTYSASTQTWVPSTPSGGSSALSGLTDVTISSGVTTGSTIMYDGSKWNDINPLDYYYGKPIIYSKSVNIPFFQSASLNNIEGVTFANGGATARTFNDSTPLRATPRIGLVGTVTGTVGGSTRQPNSSFSMTTGFDCLSGFNMVENATSTGIRFFIGIRGTTGVFSNVEPDTLTNIIGFARLSTSDNLHLIHNDNTGTATTIDLGTDFPANTVNADRYYFTIKTVPTGVFVKIDRIDSGISYSNTLTTDLPLTATALSFGGYIVATTGANTSTGFDFYGAHITFQNNII